MPGYVDVGEQTIELHPADGHTVDGMAVWIPWAAVLVAGDYLSPVEIPMISEGGSVSAYLATLRRLEPLVEQAEWVVPGHGGPIDGTRALAILREDRAYLEALPGCAALPLARRTKAQRTIHAENLTRREFSDAGRVAQLGSPDGDQIAVAEGLGALDALAVEADAVAAPVIEQHRLALAAHDQRVPAGDGDVLEFDVGGDGAADPCHTVVHGDHAVVGGDVQGRLHVSKIPVNAEAELREL